MKRILLCLTLILSLFLFSVPVMAKDKNTGPELTLEEQQQLDARLTFLSDLVAQKVKSKATKAELYAALEEVGVYHVNVQSVDNPKLKSSKTKNFGEITPQSNEDYCINLPTAELYWDSGTSKYFAYAYFFWNDPAYWQADCPGTYSQTNVGGKDAFGLAFSRPINRYSQRFLTWDNYHNTWIDSTVAQSANSYGVAFNKQDIAFDNGAQYTFDEGMVSLYMLPQETGTYTFWQEMGHTWYTTDISNVSVDISGITFTFTQTNNKWEAIAPTSGSYTFY